MEALWKACDASSHSSMRSRQTARLNQPLAYCGLRLRQAAIAVGGVGEVVQFKLDVAHGAVNFGRSLAGLHGALQLFERFFALSGQVQRDGAA